MAAAQAGANKIEAAKLAHVTNKWPNNRNESGIGYLQKFLF